MQAEVNIGLLGHVDHGKTTLTYAMTGKMTDTHSEELKRGISIRVGYADANIYYCDKCKKSSFSKDCKCGGIGKLRRRISFVDAPGHETLMTTVIAVSSILNGALFLIAANEKCPQSQTKEHFMVLEAMGIKNIVIVQTKVDLISKEKALENYDEIRNFLKGTMAENAPIVPVAANYNLNLDALADAIEKYIPTPKSDDSAPLRAYISRSFNVNKPGTHIDKLRGGIIGGSIAQGKIAVGDEIELSPGVPTKENGLPKPVKLKIVSLREENDNLKVAKSGGLVAFGTDLDPSFTRSDMLAGTVLGKSGELPEPSDTLNIEYSLLQRKDAENRDIKENEILAINVYTMTTVGVVAKVKKGKVTVKLKKSIPIEKGIKVAITRRFGQRWKLSAWGKIV